MAKAKRKKLKEPTVDSHGYPLKARDIDRDTWLYEERAGLTVIRQIRDPKGRLVSGDAFLIPWRFILAAAKTRQRLAK